MKIAVTAMGPGLGDAVSARFGRCPYFLLVDTDDMKLVESVENGNASAAGGAGVQSAQMVVDREAQAVLTGDCGPKARQVLDAAGIKVCVGVTGVVKEAVEAFKAGDLG